MKRCLLVVLFLLLSTSAFAAQVRVMWDYKIEDESHIDGFRIYYGPTSHASVTAPQDLNSAVPYATRIQIDDKATRSYFLDLPPGTYFFRMTAYGVRGGNPAGSSFSSEATGVVGIIAPGNVSISVTITFP